MYNTWGLHMEQFYHLKHKLSSQVNVKKGAEQAPYLATVASTSATTESVGTDFDQDPNQLTQFP